MLFRGCLNSIGDSSYYKKEKKKREKRKGEKNAQRPTCFNA